MRLFAFGHLTLQEPLYVFNLIYIKTLLSCEFKSTALVFRQFELLIVLEELSIKIISGNFRILIRQRDALSG